MREKIIAYIKFNRLRCKISLEYGMLVLDGISNKSFDLLCERLGVSGFIYYTDCKIAFIHQTA
jgi:hypothetical protein